MKSIFSELIKNHPEDSSWSWRDKLQEEYPGIIITESDDHPYVLFRYSIGCDFSDPLVQEARGIILNKYSGRVVCFPFRKFGKYYEPYADKIDWSTARVLDKLDGSIIKLWFDWYHGKWAFSTNGCIYAEDAKVEIRPNEYATFMDLIKKAENYPYIKSLIDNDELSKDTTYIFELTGPYNQVVIHYSSSYLWHIGTRNNITGEESNTDIGVKKPFEFDCKSLDECIQLINQMNTKGGEIDRCDFEGFVVVDANWNRIKVKSSIYQVLHNIVSGTETSRLELIKLLYNKKINISSICYYFPNITHYLKYYDFMLTQYICDCNAIIDVSRKIYKLSGNDRKTVALCIKDHKYKTIGFMCLDNEYTFDEILSNMKIDKYIYLTRAIPVYVPTPIDAFEKYYKLKEDLKNGRF